MSNDTAPVVTVSNRTATHGQSLAASSLFTANDPDGDTITNYAFWDTGSGGGHFVLNGVLQGTNQEIDVTAGQLSQLTYQSGSGADTLWVRAYDGTQWSPWSTSFTVTAPADAGATVTLTSSNYALAKGQNATAASNLFTAGDADNDAIADYAFWNVGNGGGRFLINGVAQGTNQAIVVAAGQLSQVTYQPGSGGDTLWVQAYDGYVWGPWSSGFTVSPYTDTPATATGINTTATHGQSFAAANLFTASDPDGDAITEYAFWNTGAGGGHFVLNGVTQGTNQEIDVSTAHLSQLTYQSGSGADTLWVRAYDGTQWGPWSSSFTVTTPVDTPATVSGINTTAAHGQSLAAATLFTASDPDGDAITEYAFWNTGAGGGHFALNGVTQGTNQEIDVSAAQLSHLTYQSGSGADTLWVRAFDGTQWGPWSSAFTVTAPVDSGATVTPTSANVVLAQGQSSIAASSLFTASDADGDTVASYGFYNNGGGGGRFLINGVAQGTNQEIIVSAAQLSQVTYQPGSGGDTLWVQAYDGYAWGPWSSGFTVSPHHDTPAAATGINTNAAHGQSFAALSLFTARDPDGDAITEYAFWNLGNGGAHFVLNGVVQAANQEIDVNASQLPQLTFQSGSGADTLYVAAFDGTQWGSWSSGFTVTAPTNAGATVTPTSSNYVLPTGQGTVAASSLFTASDADGDAIVSYDFYNTGGGGGRFLINGVTQAINQQIVVSAGQLSQVTYQRGTGGDTLWVAANDGYVWSQWSSGFTVSGSGSQQTPPVVTASNVTLSSISVAASSLFAASDPDGDAITQYAFLNLGTGGAYFALNGVALAANQPIVVSAAQLSQLTYHTGSGADTLQVRAYDGTQWSGWTPGFWATGPVGNSPDFTVTLDDPSHLSQDTALITDADAAAADWAQYFSGLGTIEIEIDVTPTTRANGGPVTVVPDGTNGSRTVYEAGTISEMTTGSHPSGTPPDIVISIDPTYLQDELWLDPNPGGPSPIPSNRTDAVSVLRHELGHSFGIITYRDLSTGTLPAAYEMTWDELTQIDGSGHAWFTGANAEAVYGGPVPVTSVQNGEQYAHLGNSLSDADSNDLMNGLQFNEGTAYHISSLDLAILKDLGAPITTLTPNPSPVPAGDAPAAPAASAVPDVGLLAQQAASSLVSGDAFAVSAIINPTMDLSGPPSQLSVVHGA